MLTTLQVIHPSYNAAEWRAKYQWHSLGLVPVGNDFFHSVNGWFCLHIYW